MIMTQIWLSPDPTGSIDSFLNKTSFRKMNLVGDKGYKLNQQKLNELGKKKIRMHVPNRKKPRLWRAKFVNEFRQT